MKNNTSKGRSISSSLDFNPLFGAFHPYTPIPFPHEFISECKPRRAVVHPLMVSGSYTQRKIRSEKKAIPDEQKDGRYYERRKRNNQAAKKSRDARKLREDQIALRAAILEHENAMMRAQILTLREETQALREMLLLTKKPPDYGRTSATTALIPNILGRTYIKSPLLSPVHAKDAC